MNRNPNRWLIAFVTALSSLALATVAGAQQTEWVSGSITQMSGTNCSILGSPYTEFMLNGFASYLRFTDQSAPKTGDSTYVSVVMSVPDLNCNQDSSVGVIPALVLPQGASLNITAQTPVRCFYRINNLALTQFTGTQLGGISQQGTGLRVGPVCPDGQGGGVGTPFQIGPSGTYGGLALAIQYLPRTSFLEIQVPIKFEKELLGVSGPNGGDKLQYIFDTVGLTPDPATAATFINVPYRAVINYPTPANNITTSSAQLNAELFSYFKGGTAFFDYGTTTAYGSSVSQNVASTNVGYYIFNDVTGLTPSTTYNYRLRYVTTSGTFTGANRTFTTAAAQNQTLTVSKVGTGAGTVSSNPAGINCGAVCSASFTGSSSVTLSATPATGSSFAGWSGGGCSGSGACVVTMSAAQSVTASFTAQIGSLTLTLGGLPSGSSATVGLTGPGGFSTSRTLVTGTGQNLSDVAVGAYTVTAPNVTVGNTVNTPNIASQSATVTFGGTATINIVYSAVAPTNFALSVTKAGTGAGSISSNPGGILCGATCAANFGQASSVTLSAAPDAGSSFAGWGGACSGSGACVVTMSAVQGVTASFALNTPTPPAPPSPPAPPAPPPASLGKPSGSPSSLNANKSDRNVGALSLELGVGSSSPVTLQALSLTSSGTGNDALDITGVKVYVDANGNGIVDAGETALAQGTFNGNNGTTALTLASPRVFAVGSTTKLLVTLDFNSSLAQTSFKLALGSLGLALLLGWRSKKRLAVVGLLALAVTLNACPAPITPPTGSSTYTISLTGISLKDVNGAAITVSGLPIAGTTITVNK